MKYFQTTGLPESSNQTTLSEESFGSCNPKTISRQCQNQI